MTKPIRWDKIKLKYNYFIFIDNTLQLIDNYDFLRVIDFFNQYSNKLLVHQSKFEALRLNLLSRLEHKIDISYTYLKPATGEQLQATSLEQKTEKILYLSDTDNYVLITPVMKYGDLEIPVLSRKQLYLIDLKGQPFTIPRNEEAELQFTTSLIRQQPDFQETNGDHYYLHKSQFLNKEWFLEAFEAWEAQNITVLGFKELSKNKYAAGLSEAKFKLAKFSG